LVEASDPIGGSGLLGFFDVDYGYVVYGAAAAAFVEG